ncbi:restriction endonuclease subunit S [Niallia sp. JL1B1071]|uniref:restriction endonuclease subunit S n=1 Tax=Niallia tiangongensis TaxID=3237105 RepID=UPI0037DC6127
MTNKLSEVALKDIIDIRDGTHDSPKYVNEGFPLITSKNIKDGEIDFSNVNLISEEDYKKINKRSEVSNGDIIMPMIGTIGNPMIVNTEKKFAIKNVALFKFDSDRKLNNSYLYYYLKSDLFHQQINFVKRGGTQSFISLSDIRNLRVPIFNTNYQQKVVKILKKAENLIELRKAQIVALFELMQSIFFEMFGDLRENNNWDKVPLSELIEVDTKVIKTISDYQDYNLVGIDNIEKISGKLINLRTIKESKVSGSKYYFKSEHILYSKIRPYLNKVAIPNFEGLCSTDAYPLKVKEGKANKAFIAFILRSDAFVKYAVSNSKGANIPRIDKKQLLNYLTINPNIDLQNDFEVKYKFIQSKIELLEYSLNELEINFKSLTQGAFKGDYSND